MSGETARSENTLATTMVYKNLTAACLPLLTLIVGSQPQRTQPGLLINGLSLWFPNSALLCPRVTAASSREPLNNVFQSEHSDVCQAPCDEGVWSCLLVSFSQVFLLASLGAMQSVTKAVGHLEWRQCGNPSWVCVASARTPSDGCSARCQVPVVSAPFPSLSLGTGQGL